MKMVNFFTFVCVIVLFWLCFLETNIIVLFYSMYMFSCRGKRDILCGSCKFVMELAFEWTPGCTGKDWLNSFIFCGSYIGVIFWMVFDLPSHVECILGLYIFRCPSIYIWACNDWSSPFKGTSNVILDHIIACNVWSSTVCSCGLVHFYIP